MDCAGLLFMAKRLGWNRCSDWAPCSNGVGVCWCVSWTLAAAVCIDVEGDL